jgi:hypothetical protein
VREQLFRAESDRAQPVFPIFARRNVLSVETKDKLKMELNVAR